MPDPPIMPPNKGVEKYVTQYTLEVSEMYKDEPNELKRANMIITDLIKTLAKIKAMINAVNEK